MEQVAKDTESQAREHVRNGEIEIAIECYQEAANLWEYFDHSRKPVCYESLYYLYLQTGDLDKAERMFDPHVQFDGEFVHDVCELAQTAVCEGLYRRAFHRLNTSTDKKIPPHSPSYTLVEQQQRILCNPTFCRT